jgi:hypothetical protein
LAKMATASPYAAYTECVLIISGKVQSSKVDHHTYHSSDTTAGTPDPPGHVVSVNEALGVEEDEDHLFCPRYTFALIGPGSPFLSHCFDCCFVSGV